MRRKGYWFRTPEAWDITGNYPGVDVHAAGRDLGDGDDGAAEEVNAAGARALRPVWPDHPKNYPRELGRRMAITASIATQPSNGTRSPMRKLDVKRET